jgi:beta-lactamase regulating signal transducer with metallopeptidase domain
MNWLPAQISMQIAAQTFAQRSVERVVNSLPEGLLIALFAWALLRILRRQNSGTRFAVWFFALLSVVALPFLAGFSVSFGVGEIRALAAAKSLGNLRPAISVPSHWAFYLFAAWAFGATIGLARLTAGFWRLRQLRGSCTSIAVADLDPVVRQTIGALGPITIATSDRVRVPAAIGFFNRTVVLPAWALRELSPSDLNVVLLHEFAHLRRGDDWTNLIQKIVGALFFFHPAVWWIENQLSVEREMACDDAVLAETANPRGYAGCLISLLEKSLAHQQAANANAGSDGWSMAQAVVSRAREASLRLAQILDANRPKATRVWTPALSLVSAFSLVCLVALPHAPQFVAFDRGDSVVTSTVMTSSVKTNALPFQAGPGIPAVHELASYRPTGQTAAVIPASLSKLPNKVAQRKSDAPQFVATKSNAANVSQSADVFVPVRFSFGPNSGADGSQQIAPQVQTLVFVESTRYVVSDSQLWRVQVWRVTTFSQFGERSMRIPVVNSI